MIITAKFASACPCCNNRITAGSKVEWSRGSKAMHLGCAAQPGAKTAAVSPARAPAQRRSNGLGRRTGCSCGSQEGGSKSTDCWTCRHDAE